MNDELDALRSFRPEATGPTDALQLQERIALMETIAHVTTVQQRRTPRLGSRRRLFLGIAIALVAAVGTAGATGVIPDDVQQALGLAAAHSPDASLSPQIDQAVERASASTGDGGVLELWTAPTADGGTCAYLRQLDADGAPTEAGPISCAISIPDGGKVIHRGVHSSNSGQIGQSGAQSSNMTMTIGDQLGDGSLGAEAEVDASGAATVFGQAPAGVTTVEIIDSTGAVLGEGEATDGWFLLTIPAGSASAATSLVAQSASGASLATVPVSMTIPPPPAITGSDPGSESGAGTPATSGTAPA